MDKPKEYILREEAQTVISEAKHATKSEDAWEMARRLGYAIAAIPAADVEPVVRCPKCVNGQRVNNVWTRCAKDGTRRLDSFYCAHGKERER